MAVHTNHPNTIQLPHCFVCKEKFVEHGGAAHREIHHIIPVAYGGIDGPTVDLCDTHHSALHKIAVAVRAKKVYRHLLGTTEPEQVNKLLWLASKVNEAQAATLNDPNKKQEVFIKLDANTKKQIEQLLPLFPAIRGREALFKMALDHLYRTKFLR